MRYHNISSADMLNGDDLGVVLWVAGCNHQCKNCHNPITWDPTGGLEFDSKAKEELFIELDKPYHKRLTLSGGDPLHPSNVMHIRDLVLEIRDRNPDIVIWLYSGSTYEELEGVYLEVVDMCDVFVDGEFVEELADPSLQWVGSSNQKVRYNSRD